VRVRRYRHLVRLQIGAVRDVRIVAPQVFKQTDELAEFLVAEKGEL